MERILGKSFMKLGSNTNILITGSGGYLGSHILEYLGAKGITDDIRNKEALKPYFKNIDYVIHAAGKTPGSDNYHDVNVLGTKNVAELCIENNCKMIHLGSVETREDYGISKQESQDMLMNMKGLKVVILKLCSIAIRGDHRRYPLQRLLEDIENIIKSHNFDEKSINLYKPEKSV